MTTAIQNDLAECFDATEVRWKPQTVRNNRALAIAYIDARCVMDRLDEVLGVGGWQDSYVRHADGTVECTLRLRIDGEWISRTDVGSESEQTDVGDRAKAAYSDALKRAAVKFGIGRYLYRLPHQWVDYDQAKKNFTSPPKLPSWALPKGQSVPTPVASPKPASQPAANSAPAGQRVPATGEELHKRLREADSQLAAKGICAIGSLLQHVLAAGEAAGYGSDINGWPNPAIELAIEKAREFKAALASQQQLSATTAPQPAAEKMTPHEERQLLEAIHSFGKNWMDTKFRAWVCETLGITLAVNDRISILSREQGQKLIEELRAIKARSEARRTKKAGAA